MACTTIHTWTFSTLVGAFLDLGVSYLLLCCSALAYIAAKFLGFFGLYLPCPCNGLFGDPDGTKCLQRLLVDAPSRKISSVQMSVRTRFPFDSIWSNTTDCNGRHLVEFVNDKTRGGDGGVLEIQGGEESCSSFSEAQNSRSFTVSSSPVSRDERVGSEADVNSCSARRGRSDGKGKGILHQKPPSGLRRRRRASAAVVHGKFSAVSSSSDATPPPRLLQMVGEMGIDKFKERLSRVNSDHAEDMPMGVNLIEGDLPNNGSNGLLGENEVMDKYSSFVEELVRSARCGDLGKEANAIRVLEQALEEEHASSTALYVELEKERSAAASAADEAMAMILRLQEEKASIEMEARQYQRLIEEKSAYDEEEMNILKEILVRREREKHFLEKEVEAYRKMILSGGGHQLSEDDLRNMVDISGERPCSSFDSSEDPMMLMLQELSESIGKKEIGKDVNRSPQSVPSAENRSTLYVFGNESPSLDGAEDVDFIKRGDSQRMGSMDKHYPHPHVQECMDEVNVEFQEKGMVSMDVGPSTPRDDGSILENDSIAVKLMDGSREGGLHDETFLWANGHRQKDEPAISQEAAAEKGDNACSGVDFGTSQFDMESSIHDVHVVDDKQNMVGGKESELLQTVTVSESSNEGGISLESSALRKIDVLSDHPSSSRVATEEHIHRSRSDTAARFLPRDGSRGKVLFSDSRRTSLSEVDYERLKLETEVGRLTERLRIVQEGREKLTFSVGHRERENFQLQLLEEIASQLREIRSLTEPGKAARQASLPPPSSKANSKKRRCRSVSWGVQESS
ncbi:uncharacterized protein LOC131246438 isoform X2 [Magnolia sinica]|uniref:uncharacterized protein LOC131246438 isoform X2 n=1 Tax=Magnolia sinica TaxID=86752 RepID=UPI002658F493|nr:uncharacterized protein LOC131246438 isoform X2 [Magnolia sinica]